MKSGTCPKCGKKEIHYKQNRSYVYRNNIWITDFREAATTVYVCSHCGFVEFYLEREKDLERIRRKWKQSG